MKKTINNIKHALNSQQKSFQATEKSSQAVEIFAKNDFIIDDSEELTNYFKNNMYFSYLKIIISTKV